MAQLKYNFHNLPVPYSRIVIVDNAILKKRDRRSSRLIRAKKIYDKCKQYLDRRIPDIHYS